MEFDATPLIYLAAFSYLVVAGFAAIFAMIVYGKTMTHRISLREWLAWIAACCVTLALSRYALFPFGLLACFALAGLPCRIWAAWRSSATWLFALAWSVVALVIILAWETL